VQLAVEHAMACEQLRQQVQHGLEAAVHQALDTLLVEQPAANGRVALELQPLVGLLVELAGQW
jgi:hypothetical protein